MMNTRKKLIITSMAAVLGVFAVQSIPQPAAAANCQQGEVNISIPIEGDNPCIGPGVDRNGNQVNVIYVWLFQVIRFMAAGVGICVLGGVVVGGIMYTTAGGNAAKTKAAITVIKNAAIALLLYVFMFAIVNFVLPGGVLQ